MKLRLPDSRSGGVGGGLLAALGTLAAIGCTTKPVDVVIADADVSGARPGTGGRGGAGPGPGGSAGMPAPGGAGGQGGGPMTGIRDGGTGPADGPRPGTDGPSLDAPARTDASCPANVTVKKALGQACACGPECASGFCVDGVCCNLACTGACVSCNVPGKMGECAPVPAGQPDPHAICKKEDASSCGQDGTCNGLGGCAKHKAGTMCKPAACSGGELIPASICNGNGTCIVGAPIPCAPYACVGSACKASCTVATSATDCAPPNTCRTIAGIGLSCGKKGLGQDCRGGVECESGFCADGVCCDGACSGRCSYCKFPDRLGRCVAVPADVPDPRAAAGVTDPARVCVDQGAASCGTNGRCNGAGGCQTYPNGTVCRGETCDPATSRYTGEGVCQAGACVASGAAPCAPYRCGGNRCATSCTTNAECLAPNVCQNGSCGKKPTGAICARGDECLSGFCAQGACCSTACTASCHSCGIAGSRGTCKPVAAGVRDPQGACPDQGPASCGTDGLCDGAGKCRLYGTSTICVQGSCTDGVATLPSKCDGKGLCVGQGKETCFPYVCNPQGSCYTSCTSTGGQCAAGKACDADNSCGKNALGSRCTTGADCLSGFCVDGRCCMTGSCPSCKFCGTKGLCENVAAGEADPRGVCTMKKNADPTSCREDGLCDGAGGCRFYGTDVQCRWQSCPLDSNMGLLDSFCDGKGNCDVRVQSCGNTKCDPAVKQCRQTCAGDADCFGTGCDMSTMPATCGKQPLGATCSVDGDCASNLCADGVCCNERCDGLCRACNVRGSVGRCSYVGDNKTDDTCKDFRTGSRECGNGVCSQNTGRGIYCKYLDENAECMARCGDPARGETASSKYYKVCGATGQCGGTERSSACNPYLCAPAMGSNKAQCRQSCDYANPDSCASGYQCVKVDLTTGGSVGECRLKAGASCAGNGDCASGVCWRAPGTATTTPGVCCDKACGGTCQTCASTGICRECGRGDRCGCASGTVCTGGTGAANVCKKENGQTCTPSGDGSECLSTLCAPDGRCCDKKCDGACQTCGTGTCTDVTSGSNGGRCPIQTVTPGSPAACTATLGCQPGGVCGRPGAETRCGAAMCTSGGQVQVAVCDGNGGCAAGTPTSCPMGATCQGGSCRLADGQPCTSDGDCLNQNCFKPNPTDPTASGVCCNRACDITKCERCDVAGSAGTCQSTCSSTQACQTGTGGGAGTCKLKNGQPCGQAGDCLTGSSCVKPSSGDPGVCCASACNSEGCERCKADGSACESKCSASQYCVPMTGGYGTCANKAAAGGACADSGQCQSGLTCVKDSAAATTGVCCMVACDVATCQRCKTNGSGCESRCNASTEFCTPATTSGGYGSCTAKLPLNSDCTSDAQCASGKCDTVAMKCKAQAGQDCPSPTDCATGLICNSSMKCAAPGGAGNVCVTDIECGAGLTCQTSETAGVKRCCSATCSAAACEVCGASGTCTSKCTSGEYCSSGACAAKKADGDACGADGECTSGKCVATKSGGKICCAVTCASASCQVCVEAGAMKGMACETKCSATEYCGSGGLCAAKGGPGASCTAPEQCLGTCESGSCKATIGQACPNGGGDCAAGTTCEGGTCKGTLDTTCASQSQCAAAYYCNAENKCKNKKGPSESCTQGYECLSGACVDTGGTMTCM
jgi:hypothetical protein